MENKLPSGIYKILCNLNGKVYIGKSTNMQHRLADHKAALEAGTHINKLLQEDYSEWGTSCFKFKVLQHCPEQLLNSREAFWIIKLNAYEKDSGYNTIVPGFGDLIPYSRKNNMTNQPRKPIIEIDIATGNTTFFDCASEVTSKYGIPPKNLREILSYWKHASSTMKDKRMSWNGKIFVYEEKYDFLFDYVTYWRLLQSRLLASSSSSESSKKSVISLSC